MKRLSRSSQNGRAFEAGAADMVYSV